jgi:hypothetical protein
MFECGCAILEITKLNVLKLTELVKNILGISVGIKISGRHNVC